MRLFITHDGRGGNDVIDMIQTRHFIKEPLKDVYFLSAAVSLDRRCLTSGLVNQTHLI